MFISQMTKANKVLTVAFDRNGDSTREYKQRRARTLKISGRTLRVLVTDKQIDSENESVDPRGVMFDNYMRGGSGTVLLNHQIDKPIAKCVYLEKDRFRVMGIVEFPAPGVSPQSDMAFEQIKSGHLAGWSAGFRPIVTEPLPNGGRHFKRVELLEISLCPQGANPRAVVLPDSNQTSGGQLPTQDEQAQQEQRAYCHFAATRRKEIERAVLIAAGAIVK
jgi:HK97 family phage prohead protease